MDNIIPAAQSLTQTDAVNSVQTNGSRKPMSFKKQARELAKAYRLYNKQMMAEWRIIKYERIQQLKLQKLEAKEQKALERSLRPTKHNIVAIYKPVRYTVVRIIEIESYYKNQRQFSLIFKTNLSETEYVCSLFVPTSMLPAEFAYKPSTEVIPAICYQESVQSAVVKPIYEQLTLQAESLDLNQDFDLDEQYNSNESDWEDSQPSVIDRRLSVKEQIKQLSEEDRECYDLYMKALKNYTGSQVCGKRKRKTFVQFNTKFQQNLRRRNIYLNSEQLNILSQLIVNGFEYRQDQDEYDRIKADLQKLYGAKKIETILTTAKKNILIRRLMLTFNIKDLNKLFQFKLKLENGSYLMSKINTFWEAYIDLRSKISQLHEEYQSEIQNFNIIGATLQILDKPVTSIEDRVRGGRNIMTFNQNYLVISPLSDTNCFYHCLVYFNLLAQQKFEKIYDQEYIVERAKELKRQFGNEKDYSDIQDIAKVANYYGCQFTIYNNLFNLLPENAHIKGQKVSKERKSSKLINADIKLQFVKGHCCLLIPRFQYPQFTQQFEKVQAERHSQDKPIIPKPVFAKVTDRYIMTYDSEAYKKTKQCGTQIPFAIGLCTGMDLKQYPPVPQYHEFYSENCISQFFDYLSEMKLDKKTTTKTLKNGKKVIKEIQPEVFLYAHNGAKYDVAIVNETLFKRTDFKLIQEEFMELNGGVINQSIINKHGVKFVFRDSMRIFAGSLDGLCKDLKPYFRKQTGHKFQFDKLNGDNVYNDASLKAEISDYLKHDCLSLAQILIEFREKLLKEPTIELDICDCFTSATLAKKLYFNKYYERYTKATWVGGKQTKRRYIWQVNRKTDQYLRNSYFGGRCDIYKFGKFKKVYYYDFTSLYPYVGAKKKMPIGKPIFVEGSEIDIKKFFGFIRCRVTTNKNTIPLHGIKYNNKLVFAHHTNTEMTLFSEEIKKGLELGYKYEFLDGDKFETSYLLRDIMKDGFERKAAAKKAGETVMEKTWKIVINSAYGFFGLRWMDKRGIKFMNEEQLHGELDNGKVYNYNQISDDAFIVDCENDMEEVKGKSIAIASAVTSYARMCLYEIMESVQQKGHTIYYTDTDSIITDCNIKEHQDMLDKFQWDGCGDALGCVKNEALDYCKKKLSKEDLQKQIELDGGELYFDEVQVLAPKVYSLKKTLINGEIIEIVKSKGTTGATYDEQTNLLNGKTVEYSLKQFRSGKLAYMKEQDIQGRVNVTDVTKSMALFTDDGQHKYSKGYIQGADVIPLEFNNGLLVQ